MITVLILSFFLAAATAQDVEYTEEACVPATTSSCEFKSVVDKKTQDLYCCPERTSGNRVAWSSINGVTTFKCICLVPPAAEEFSMATFRENGLKRHNVLRAKHGADPLEVSDELNTMALDYAKLLAAQDSELEHSLNATDGIYGENLAKACHSWGKDYEGPEPVDAWYNEIDDPGYDFNDPRFSKGTGHFTQVVWKATTQVGQGKARTKDGKCVYAVANYLPAGNVRGEQHFRENVAPAN